MGSSSIAYFGLQRLIRSAFSKQQLKSSTRVAPLLIKQFNSDFQLNQSLFQRMYSTDKDEEEVEEEEGKLSDLDDW
jgi:hypothetical protein